MTRTRWGLSAAALAGRLAGPAAALQLAAGLAWAAEGEGGGANPWMALLWKSVNFAVLVLGIWYFGRKPIGNMLRGAAQAAQAALAGQRERARQVEVELEAQRRRIEGLEADLARMAAEARAEAELERARLVAEAHEHAERIKRGTAVQVEQEFNKARKELQAELAAETVRLAEALIRGRMDERGRQRLATRAIEQMGAAS
jgi:F-type H+-transporting ATPase subunit b